MHNQIATRFPCPLCDAAGSSTRTLCDLPLLFPQRFELIAKTALMAHGTLRDVGALPGQCPHLVDQHDQQGKVDTNSFHWTHTRRNPLDPNPDTWMYRSSNQHWRGSAPLLGEGVPGPVREHFDTAVAHLPYGGLDR